MIELITFFQSIIQSIVVALLTGAEKVPPGGVLVVVGLVFVIRLLIGKPSHAVRIGYSYFVVRKLKRLEDPKKKFYILRRLNPFTFEEVILTALKKHGFKIKRNRRYTGDGGVDGQCWWKGQLYLIQAKRYQGSINTQDVEALKALCIKKKTKGFFVHTGSTPKGAYRASGDRVQIISGDRLLALMGNGNNSTEMSTPSDKSQ